MSKWMPQNNNNDGQSNNTNCNETVGGIQILKERKQQKKNTQQNEKYMNKHGEA